jgi:hypothetical protein
MRVFVVLIFCCINLSMLACSGIPPANYQFPYEDYDYSLENLTLGVAYPPDSKQEHRDLSAYHLDNLGIKHIRMGQHWSYREPRNNVFHWSPLEDRLNFYESHAVSVLMTLETKEFPDWTENLSQTEKLAEFREFIQALLNEFASKIAFIQVGNEWNWEIDSYLNGDNEFYVALQNILYEEVKLLAPENQPVVVLGSIAIGALQLMALDQELLDNIYYDGEPYASPQELEKAYAILPARIERMNYVFAEAKYDWIDLHFYDDYWNWETYLFAVEQTLDLAGKDLAAIPVLVSEFGGPNPKMESQDEITKAERLVSYIQTLDKMDLEIAYFFKVVEDETGDGIMHPASFLIDLDLNPGFNYEVLRRFALNQ